MHPFISVAVGADIEIDVGECVSSLIRREQANIRLFQASVASATPQTHQLQGPVTTILRLTSERSTQLLLVLLEMISVPSFTQQRTINCLATDSHFCSRFSLRESKLCSSTFGVMTWVVRASIQTASDATKVFIRVSLKASLHIIAQQTMIKELLLAIYLEQHLCTHGTCGNLCLPN